MTMENNNLQDSELELKAAGVNFAIHTISDKITQELQKNVERLTNLTEEEINKVFFIVSYVSLFEAQKFFWENFIQNEEQSSVFEKELFKLFEKTSGVNPRSYLKDFVDYIQQGESSREIQYIGSKICRELSKPDALLMFEISTVYVSFLKHGFFDSLKSGWNLPNETLKKLLENTERGSHIN